MIVSKAGSHEFANMVALPEIKVVHYDHAEAVANKIVIPVEAGTFVLGIGHVCEEIFTGGTPALTIGDGTDVDGYLTLAAGSLDAVNDYVNTFGQGLMSAITTADTWTPVAFAHGYFYSAAGSVVVTLSVALTAGKGAVHLMTYNTLGDWRIPNL